MNPVYEIRKKLAEKYYNGRCYICHKKVTTGKNFVFHHLWYLVTVKDKYNNFRTQLAYHKHLEHEISIRPERFLCLCNPCHIDINRKGRFSTDRLMRLIETIRQTEGSKLYESN